MIAQARQRLLGAVSPSLQRSLWLQPVRETATASRPAPIAIIGGGPSGLTFARLLEIAGVDYVVFERDRSFEKTTRFQGGTLDLGPEGGQAALKSAGLLSEFEKYARYDAACFTIQDYQGNHHTRTGENRDRPEIDRMQLRQLLLRSIPEQRIKWNKKLLGAEINETKKTSGSITAADCILRFVDGTSESGFRLVIGSDGAWSKVRQLITPSEPTYFGRLFVEGAISPSNPKYERAVELAGVGNSIATGDHQCLCVQQMGDRSYRVYMGIEVLDSMTRPGGELDLTNTDKARTRMNELYSDWEPRLRDIVTAAEGPWRAWPLYQQDERIFAPSEDSNDGRPSGSSWKRIPGVTLLGDAAHLAVPNGEGVNHAMTDARRLFECLIAEIGENETREGFDQHADAAMIERVILAYEADMFPRGRESILDGVQMMAMLFSKDGAKIMTKMFTEAMENQDQT